jgi:acyl-coenzyme A synthetase/AMP-(fatty) acid ligase
VQVANRLHLPQGPVSWQELARTAAARLGDAGVGERAVFVVGSVSEALAAVAHGVTTGLDFGVIEAGRLSPEVEARFAESGVQLRSAQDGAALGQTPLTAEVKPGRITVLTSGTTGLLKLIPHSSASLNTFDRVGQMPPNRWFLPYQIGSYAWYQMVALGLFVADQELVPADFADLAGSFETAIRQGLVTAISSTPTFWRHAFMTLGPEMLGRAPLRAISMGGEIVDQAILDRLAALYPEARLRHIYASSEAGAAIVVTDGKAGFDAAILQRKDGPVSLRIEDGRLFIRSRYGNSAETGGWIDTGDLVEERAGRIHFLGRAGNAMINVGGQKAFPPDIEAQLLRHPDVLWARVTARRAPLMGHLPVATVVLRRPMDPTEAEAMLTAHCETHLADYAIPRIWDFPDRVPLRASLKS